MARGRCDGDWTLEEETQRHSGQVDLPRVPANESEPEKQNEKQLISLLCFAVTAKE